MPDVYGDAAADLNSFADTADGYFAELPETPLFTQEWNFALNGGNARVMIGQQTDKAAIVTVIQERIALRVGDEEIASAMLPEIGPADCLHTLRVENTLDILYLYMDDMRVLTAEKLALTAASIGAYKAENVTYSFMACTVQALGSGDNTAVKLIPGDSSAIHALNADELHWEHVGPLEEKAPLLGEASYLVRVAATGEYCFDLTVRKADAGKAITLTVDGEKLWTGTAPEFSGKGG